MHSLTSHRGPPPNRAAIAARPARGADLGRGGLRYLYLRRVVGTALGAMGFATSMRLGRRLARGVWELEGPARRQAEQRIAAAQEALGLPSGEPAELGRACFEHVAMFWIETLFARRRLRPTTWSRCVRLPDEKDLRAVCDSDTPAIFVTGYLGHPGAGAFVLGQLCRPLYVLVDVLTHPVLRAWQADLYHQPHVRLISRRRSLVELPAVLEAGGKVMLVGHQPRADDTGAETTLAGRKGDAVTFLGRRQQVHQTVRLLSQRYHAPVIVFGCFRNSDRFDFTLRLAGRLEPTAADLSQQTTSLLQSLILTHPEQYLWTLRST